MRRFATSRRASPMEFPSRATHAPARNIPGMDGKDPDERVELPLDKAVEYMLEECRMVLPGIQTLFGFQLVVVFSDRFQKSVDASGRMLHMGAILFVAIAIALIMSPAALHRRTDPRSVNQRYLATCSRLILASMLPLASAIVIET